MRGLVSLCFPVKQFDSKTFVAFDGEQTEDGDDYRYNEKNSFEPTEL